MALDNKSYHSKVSTETKTEEKEEVAKPKYDQRKYNPKEILAFEKRDREAAENKQKE